MATVEAFDSGAPWGELLFHVFLGPPVRKSATDALVCLKALVGDVRLEISGGSRVFARSLRLSTATKGELTGTGWTLGPPLVKLNAVVFLRRLFFLLLFPIVARADYTWDTSLFYFSDSFVAASTMKYGFTLWATSLNIEVGQTRSFFVGWNILGVSHTLNNGTAEQFTSTEMGPRFMYMGRSGSLQIAVSYHLSSTNSTTYDSGSGTAAKLKGTAIFAEIAYLPELKDGWRLGCKLAYYAPTFAESIVGGTTYTQVSYSRTAILPALALSVKW